MGACESVALVRRSILRVPLGVASILEFALLAKLKDFHISQLLTLLPTPTFASIYLIGKCLSLLHWEIRFHLESALIESNYFVFPVESFENWGNWDWILLIAAVTVFLPEVLSNGVVGLCLSTESEYSSSRIRWIYSLHLTHHSLFQMKAKVGLSSNLWIFFFARRVSIECEREELSSSPITLAVSLPSSQPMFRSQVSGFSSRI